MSSTGRRRCGIATVGRASLRTLSPLTEAQLAVATSNELLEIETVYFVLYRNADENVSLAQLTAQHTTLRACYRHRHGTRVQVPVAAPYAYGDRVGSTAITFAPETLTEDYVTRIAVASGRAAFADLTEVMDYLQANGHALPAGKLVIASVPFDGLLGIAELGGQIAAVDYRTVGGEDAHAPNASYNLGFTAVHESGHVLNLVHPFSEADPPVCGEQIWSDVPAQKYPNWDYTGVEQSDGTWVGTLCNRYRDAKIAAGESGYDVAPEQKESRPYSCWNFAADGNAPLYEMGFAFMDYAFDEQMAAFSRQQGLSMRMWLVNDNNTLLSVRRTGIAETDMVTTTPAAEDTAAQTASSTPAASSEGPTSTTSSTLDTMTIVYIVLGVVGAIALVALGVWLWRKRTSRVESQVSPAAAAPSSVNVAQ